jgi:squalene-associated FAD-dependent desaturase
VGTESDSSPADRLAREACRIGVVGGGWAGLAAAVRACEAGHRVVLFEMAPQLGGRARAVETAEGTLDNGQHILIGAYRRTLDLMRKVDARPERTLARLPLELRYPDGRGLRVGPGPSWIGFLRAVAGANGWRWRDRAALARVAAGWVLRGFRCTPGLTVDQLCATLPGAVRALMIDPLCVAALNTPAHDASAAVLLRVLRDALFGGPGASDLLLPRRPLDELLPRPAATWLCAQGAKLRLGHRVRRLAPDGNRWLVDGEACDAVVLACTAAEAARLTANVAPHWAAAAGALRYEPIVTVTLRARGSRLPVPMTALVESAWAPAQFAFDHGALGRAPGHFAFVVSGARAWVERGLEATGRAVLTQSEQALRRRPGAEAPVVLRVLADKRATFRCTPDLARPPAAIRGTLVAAGDYVAGPYPATLEGAVRSGEAAIARLLCLQVAEVP